MYTSSSIIKVKVEVKIKMGRGRTAGRRPTAISGVFTSSITGGMPQSHPTE